MPPMCRPCPNTNGLSTRSTAPPITCTATRNMPISMALLHKGKLQEALVYAPERNDCYMASRGQGALRNDRRIRVSNRIELNRCLIGTGFPVVDQSMMDAYLAILKDFLAKTAGGRREGAAALDLCAPGLRPPRRLLRIKPQTVGHRRRCIDLQEPAASLPICRATKVGWKAAMWWPPTRKCWHKCCKSSRRTSNE